MRGQTPYGWGSEGNMAKPIKENPVLRGKAAKQFSKLFLSDTKPDPEKVERHKKDVEVFRQATANR